MREMREMSEKSEKSGCLVVEEGKVIYNRKTVKGG